METFLSPPKWIFSAANAWNETNSLALVPGKFLYKSTGDNGISVFIKDGTSTWSNTANFCEPKNARVWKKNNKKQKQSNNQVP